MSQRVTSHPTRFPVCCCLPTPMTLASWGVRCSRFWSTSHLIWPLPPSFQWESIHKSRGDSVLRMWVQLKRLCVSCVWVLQRDIVVLDVIWLSTLCKYDLRKGYLYVPSWERVRRVGREVCVRV